MMPEPSTLDDIANDPALKNAVAILVNVDSEKRVRVNITARESQIDRIDRLAEEAGMTRSAYFVQAALDARGRRNDNSRPRHRCVVQNLSNHHLKAESTGRPRQEQTGTVARRSSRRAGK